MITFLCVFDDGYEVTVQKSMTLAQSKIYAKDQMQKHSHILWVEIREGKNSNTLYVFKDLEYNLNETSVALINKI